MDPLRPRLADGGLATALQREGLPPFTPVDTWVLEHPDRVAAAHLRFVQAGATILLSGTFRALPGLQPEWKTVGRQAVALARSAGPEEVWASIGPWTTTWHTSTDADRATAVDAWTRGAAHLAPMVDGLLLETFTELDAGLAALAATLASGPVVLSFTPASDGRLHDGTEPAEAVRAALQAGAAAVGFNCGAAPGDVARAVARSGADGLWARPAGDPARPEAVAEALRPVVSQCAVIGGCCGAGPEAIAALADL